VILDGGALRGLEFRATEARDEPFLRALYRRSRDAELAITGWSEADKQAFADSQFTLQDRHYRNHYRSARFLVIEREGVPIGRLYVDRGEKELLVVDVLLEASERNAGLGTAILEDLQADAARRGIPVTLQVQSDNRARSLYRRLGFREEAGEGLYVPMRWDPPVKRG